MGKIKQLVFADAVTDKAEGYQYIAESEGVSERIKDIVMKRSKLSGVIPADFEFKEATAFYSVDEDYYAFSRIINAGLTHDNRPNAYYVHTLLIPREDLKKSEFNLKYLESLFFYDKEVRGILNDIEFDVPVLETASEDLDLLAMYFKSENRLACFIDNLLYGKSQILIVPENRDYKDLAYALFAALPAFVMENFSFISLDIDVGESNRFKLYFIPSSIYSRSRGLAVLDISSENTENKCKARREVSERIASVVFDGNVEFINNLKELARNLEVTKNGETLSVLVEYMFQVNSLEDVYEPKELISKLVSLYDMIIPYSKDLAYMHISTALSYAFSDGNVEEILSIFQKYARISSMRGDMGELLDKVHTFLMNMFGEGSEENLKMMMQFINGIRNEVNDKVFKKIIIMAAEEYMNTFDPENLSDTHVYLYNTLLNYISEFSLDELLEKFKAYGKQSNVPEITNKIIDVEYSLYKKKAPDDVKELEGIFYDAVRVGYYRQLDLAFELFGKYLASGNYGEAKKHFEENILRIMLSSNELLDEEVQKFIYGPLKLCKKQVLYLYFLDKLSSLFITKSISGSLYRQIMDSMKSALIENVPDYKFVKDSRYLSFLETVVSSGSDEKLKSKIDSIMDYLYERGIYLKGGYRAYLNILQLSVGGLNHFPKRAEDIAHSLVKDGEYLDDLIEDIGNILNKECRNHDKKSCKKLFNLLENIKKKRLKMVKKRYRKRSLWLKR